MLGETIRWVKELKKAATEIEAAFHAHGGSGEDQSVLFPSGADGLSLEHCGGSGGLVKAVVSCEDRVGLMSEMTREVGAVEGKVVKAEMVSVGGRTNCVMWVKGLGGTTTGNERFAVLKKALKVLVERRVLQATKVIKNLRFVQRDL